MLNRRSLRIKVMQFLYALERQKQAFQQMAKERSGSHFDPDQNVNEEQDLQALKVLKKETLVVFDRSFNGESDDLSDSAPEIQVAIKDGMLTFENLLKEAEKSGLKNLKDETDRISNSYIKILRLPIAWSEIIVRDWNRLVGEGKSAGSGYRNLASNPVIKAIEDNKEINAILKKNKIGWATETVAEWLRKIVRKDDFYLQYVEQPNPVLSDHREIINHIFKKIIFKNEVIDDYMEEHDLGWSENRGILKSMIIKTLKTFKEENNTINLINLSPNWSEDREFYQNLYKETIRGESQLEKLIAAKSKNWDTERIAAVDKVLMKMAITEFMQFPSIPVKVTINEYIEICKAYSTPKSKQYVNGILDVLSREMTEEGSIKKSGRGLLDNK